MDVANRRTDGQTRIHRTCGGPKLQNNYEHDVSKISLKFALVKYLNSLYDSQGNNLPK